MNWKEEFKKKTVSIEMAAKQIKSGDFIGNAQGIGEVSPAMLDAILDRWEELTDVVISDMVQVRPAKLYDTDLMKKLEGHINFCPTFVMPVCRRIMQDNIADYSIMQGHDMADRYSKWSDVFMMMVTPPNRHGMVNIGLSQFHSIDTVRLGKKSGKLRVVIAEVNDKMPVVFGKNWMHISEFDYIVENSTEIPKFGRAGVDEKDKAIGHYVHELIKDGDTLQMGLGSIPEAVVANLQDKRDLGIFSEMAPLELPQLVDKGIVTNAKKTDFQGVSTVTFAMGDQTLYDYVTENPNFQIFPSSYINNPKVIAKQDNIVAINMGLLIDFTGQITAEGIGHKMISGPGGQFDFMLGSYLADGGRGITVLYSSRKLADGKLISAIVPELPGGTPITVPRTYAQYVVTEYGIADLKYKSRRQRAEALINIAHPDLRGDLRKSLQKNFYY